MRMKALFGGLAAATLAAQPIVAAEASRPAAPVEGQSELGGDGSLIGILVFVAVVAAFYFVASEDNGDPISA